MSALSLGVDLGSSGLRLAVVPNARDAANPASDPIEERQGAYPACFEDPEGWRQGLIALVRSLPPAVRQGISAIALDGTSGTLLLCHPDGRLPAAPLDRALPYHLACPEQTDAARVLLGERSMELDHPAASASGSLTRALRLLAMARDAGLSPPLLLRHQADWLMGWLLNDWRWGEEGNNIRLGWDLVAGQWLGSIGRAPWHGALPSIRPSGTVLGRMAPPAAAALGLGEHCLVVAGSTDANAAVLAADPGEHDGISVLGTTLVLKQFVPAPVSGAGISCHRVAGRWLAGGASNAGAGILRRFFDDARIVELSRQIDPSRPTGLELRPLPRTGDRFPVDDPWLEPILEPRPVSDARYLQALLEGLTAIEVAGWQRLRRLGAPPLQRVISLGGGARNPQWRALRQRALGLPVLNRPQLSAALGMALLARESTRMATAPPLAP